MPDDIALINSMVASDIEFLTAHNIMDYSLLFAVEKFHSNTFATEQQNIKQELF